MMISKLKLEKPMGDKEKASMISSERGYPRESWEMISSPEEVGWSPQRLQQARAYAEEIGSAAGMVITGGRILVQWGEITRLFRIHSIRKSILSVLYGSLIEAGTLQLTNTLEELGIDDAPP
jgi:hypothetical protein